MNRVFPIIYKVGSEKLNIDSLSRPDALGHLMMGTVIDITMFFNQNQLQQSHR